MKPRPLLLAPDFVPRIWGVRSLAPLFPAKSDLSEPIGEVWLTGNQCRFLDGPFSGAALGDAWPSFPPAWAGSAINTQAPFPLLLKFIFPAEKLSVQVHPDDDYVRAHESARGGIGKTETWHVISAQPGAAVLVGLKPQVTPDQFRRAIADGTADFCLETIPVSAGDQIFVPAGTMHTIGPGLILCEIQQNSDITYRVFDYNRLTPEGRPRELHVEKALAVARFGPQLGGKLSPVRLASGHLAETFYVACRYFAVEKWEFTARIGAVTHPARFELLVILSGTGRLEWHAESAPFSAAQVWLLPASLGAYQLSPDGSAAVLRTFVPDVERDVLSRLRDRRVPESDLARIVFP